MVDRSQFAKLGITGAFVIAVTFIPQWEGISLKAYPDTISVWTICRGHTQGVYKGMTATSQQCEQFFESDVGKAVAQADAAIKVPVSDYELAAYTSFVYNVGIGNLRKSTMLKKLNAGDHTGACNEFPRWIYAGSKDCRKRLNLCYGLVNRRAAERELCLTH